MAIDGNRIDLGARCADSREATAHLISIDLHNHARVGLASGSRQVRKDEIRWRGGRNEKMAPNEPICRR